MKEINKIVHDEQTYIESIGKQDKETVREALADGGADTILRVCFGASNGDMPVRSLGYFASALAVQERYFPEAELQFVYPVLAASKVNGVDLAQAQDTAEAVNTAARRHFPRRFRQDSPEVGKVKSFFDANLPTQELEDAVAEVLGKEPELCATFLASAKSRDAGYVPYVAAHILMHDTNPQLLPVVSGELGANTADRVVSIGAQSERPFYLARMACQKAQLLPAEMQVATGQLFTRHVIPPYLSCREGEPRLSSVNAGLLDGIATSHSVPSVERDLIYLQQALVAEQDHYEAITLVREFV
jgi:hypothetical protein